MINWLRLFAKNPNDCRVLLEVISAHQTIKPKSTESFLVEFNKLNYRNSIFLSIKTLDDANGLHRVLYNSNHRPIIQKIDKFKDEILQIQDRASNNKTLVILADIGISGSQLKEGLDYYFNRPIDVDTEGKQTLRKDYERYYDIITELEKFRENIKSFKKIKFVLIAYTDKLKKL